MTAVTTTAKTTNAAKSPLASRSVRSAIVGSAARPRAADRDAIALLRADHRTVDNLFADFEKAVTSKDKKAIVAALCRELSVHVQIEEEIFYPAFQSALKDKLLVPEGTVEHAGIKDLIAQIEGAEPATALYDARVKVLSEYVRHHVKEEQDEMFPKARASSMDLMAIGDRMVARKLELLAARD